MATTKSTPSWIDVKPKLVDFDRTDLQDEAYFDALVQMFEQALKTIAAFTDTARQALLDRLDDVRHTSHNFGYGVGDELDELLAAHGVDD